MDIIGDSQPEQYPLTYWQPVEQETEKNWSDVDVQKLDSTMKSTTNHAGTTDLAGGRRQ